MVYVVLQHGGPLAARQDWQLRQDKTIAIVLPFPLPICNAKGRFSGNVGAAGGGSPPQIPYYHRDNKFLASPAGVTVGLKEKKYQWRSQLSAMTRARVDRVFFCFPVEYEELT